MRACVCVRACAHVHVWHAHIPVSLRRGRVWICLKGLGLYVIFNVKFVPSHQFGELPLSCWPVINIYSGSIQCSGANHTQTCGSTPCATKSRILYARLLYVLWSGRCMIQGPQSGALGANAGIK